MSVEMSQLPPKPDPYTGDPRPPSAPLESGAARKGTLRREKAKKKAPPTPEGQGPMLEWYYPDRTSRILAGLFVPVVGLIIYFVRLGPGWVGTWWLWVILLPWPFIFMLAGRNTRASAGAEWLARGGGGWVRLYELTSIKVTTVSAGMARQIELHDRSGGRMSMQIGHLQMNPKLWDLVYNGIIHSVHVGGAETNKRSREWLQLEHPPTVAKSWR